MYNQIMKETRIIDGNNFSDMIGFYEEFSNKVIPEIASWWGRNLDALNDVLGGGVAAKFIDGDWLLVWKNSNKSKKELERFDDIVEIIKLYKNIDLKLE